MLLVTTFRPVPNALPLEEAIDWRGISALANVNSLEHLGEQLECLRPKVWGAEG
jgi:hypothetical protein